NLCRSAELLDLEKTAAPTAKTRGRLPRRRPSRRLAAPRKVAKHFLPSFFGDYSGFFNSGKNSEMMGYTVFLNLDSPAIVVRVDVSITAVRVGVCRFTIRNIIGICG